MTHALTDAVHGRSCDLRTAQSALLLSAAAELMEG